MNIRCAENKKQKYNNFVYYPKSLKFVDERKFNKLERFFNIKSYERR